MNGIKNFMLKLRKILNIIDREMLKYELKRKREKNLFHNRKFIIFKPVLRNLKYK